MLKQHIPTIVSFAVTAFFIAFGDECGVQIFIYIALKPMPFGELVRMIGYWWAKAVRR